MHSVKLDGPWCRQHDKRGTFLGSLWDDENDMIMGQVADDRTRKAMVGVSAVVDSVAEANALPENMMQWIPLKPCSASKSVKIFRGAGGGPIRAQGEGSVTGRTDEGQSRRIVWEVCPVKCPLLSRPEIKSTWSRTRPSSRTTRRRSQTSVESATCGCLTYG